MKKLSLIFVLCIVIIQTSISQIKVNSSGNVGINNTSPTYRLDVVGTVKLTNSSKSVTYDGTSLSPTTGGSIDLGNSNYFWYHLYSMYGYFSYAPVVISDVNYKTNINNLSGMMDKVKLLRPVSYELRTDVTAVAVDKTKNIVQFGLIAQELQQIFPDMVTTGENGILGIRYTELIPVLVQAMNEQHAEIDALNDRISKLEEAIGKLLK